MNIQTKAVLVFIGVLSAAPLVQLAVRVYVDDRSSRSVIDRQCLEGVDGFRTRFGVPTYSDVYLHLDRLLWQADCPAWLAGHPQCREAVTCPVLDRSECWARADNYRHRFGLPSRPQEITMINELWRRECPGWLEIYPECLFLIACP